MTKKKDPSELKKVGRKSKFDPNTTPKKVKELAAQGKTNKEISKELGICEATLFNWGEKNPEFLSTKKASKEEADKPVELSLYKRALGYEYVERKVTTYEDGAQRVEETKKQVLPDVTAQIFWLKNRQPANWRDKQVQEITGKDGGPIQFAGMSDEEITKMALLSLEKIRKG